MGIFRVARSQELRAIERAVAVSSCHEKRDDLLLLQLWRTGNFNEGGDYMTFFLTGSSTPFFSIFVF